MKWKQIDIDKPSHKPDGFFLGYQNLFLESSEWT